MRKLIYYVAVTADGYIAKDDGDLSFFDNDPLTLSEIFAEYPETCPIQMREALGVTAPGRHFDTVIMGRATHQLALDAGLTSAYPHLDQYVVTHRRDLPVDDRVTVVDGDLSAVVQDLKQRDGLDIWLCGGGKLAGQLLPLIDEFHLKINPVLLGHGVAVIDAPSGPVPMRLRSLRALANGVLLAVYERV